MRYKININFFFVCKNRSTLLLIFSGIFFPDAINIVNTLLTAISTQNPGKIIKALNDRESFGKKAPV